MHTASGPAELAAIKTEFSYQCLVLVRDVLRFTGPGKRGHIVAHDVSWAAQTGKHLLRTQNVSEQNQKPFLYPGHKICVRNKCCACGQTGKHLCRQQCVRNNVSSFAGSIFIRRPLHHCTKISFQRHLNTYL